MVLNDFQRGKLPYYVKPPGCEENLEKMKKFAKSKGSDEVQEDNQEVEAPVAEIQEEAEVDDEEEN